jgi:hypothetical protein
MSTFRILVANEPRSYRDAITQVLQAMRPEFIAVSEEPADLDDMLRRHEPTLVLCSRVTEWLLSNIPAWIILYPAGASLVVTSIGGNQHTLTDVDISHLLALVDESATYAANP